MAEELKDRLGRLLDERGLSQADLAGGIGVSRAAVSAWSSGQKQPSGTNVLEIARFLEVDAAYLQYGRGVRAAASLKPQREAYERALEWYWRKPPIDQAREMGDAASFAFDPDIATLSREATQNTSDERLPGEPTVTIQFSVLELSGDVLDRFLEALRFDDPHGLRDHLAAATEGRHRIAAVIRTALDRLDETGTLLIVRIADYSATGLTGPEHGADGKYTAVVRNVLDSNKGETAGGSFGLGKSAMWACSGFGTVLVNSMLSVSQDGKRRNRFIARAELPWHETDEGMWAGPGWYGVPDPEHAPSTSSYWDNEALVHDLFVARDNDVAGTTFSIVAAFDPSGQAETAEGILDELEGAVARNFWPAMAEVEGVPPRLRATVRLERNGEVVTERSVAPEQARPGQVQALRRHLEDVTGDELQDMGDVVRREVRLTVPKRVAPGSDHPATDHDAVLIVAAAADDDDEANKLTLVRGSLMVVEERAVPGLPVGSRAFHAVLLGGEAAGETPSDRAAERFLRAAEPPAHNKWTSTTELTSSYARPRSAAIHRWTTEAFAEIRKLVSRPPRDLDDGPEALKELLRLGPPRGGSEARPRVKTATRLPFDDDDAWHIDATVSLPSRTSPWRVVPVLKFATQSGSPIPVRFIEIIARSNCRSENGVLVASDHARTMRFEVISDPASHPVGARRSRVIVDVRSVEDAV